MAEPSNTLVVSGIERTHIADIASCLKLELAKSGIAPVHWAPLKSFARVIAVFASAHEATEARSCITGNAAVQSQFGSAVRAFYAQNTPLSVDGSSVPQHLQLPDAGRLWLISPPPSPPASWESQREAEPNRQTVFGDEDVFSPDALNVALQRAASTVDPSEVSAQETGGPKKLTRRFTLHQSSPSPSPKLSIDTSVGDEHADSSSPIETPTIVLEWDDEDGGPAENRALPRTELPPF